MIQAPAVGDPGTAVMADDREAVEAGLAHEAELVAAPWTVAGLRAYRAWLAYWPPEIGTSVV